MQIQKIEIDNFYAYRHQIVDFKWKGLVLVEGPNGAGKSTLFEAIIWGITGKTIRSSTEEVMCHFDHPKRCSVIIDFTKDGKKYQIVRQRRPSRLVLFEDGADQRGASAQETQARIEAVTGLNARTVLAGNVFGQENDVRFMRLSLEQRRASLRSYLNMDAVAAYRDAAKKLKTARGADRREAQGGVTEARRQVEAVRSLTEQASAEINVHLADCDLGDLARLQEALRVNAVGYQRAEQERDSWLDVRNTCERKLSLPGSACLTCGKPMTPKELHEYRSKLNNAKANAVIAIDKHEEAMDSFFDARQKLTSYDDFDASDVESAILARKAAADIGKAAVDSEGRILELDEAVLKATEDIWAYGQWGEILSEAGILKKAFERITPFIGSRVDFYLDKLGFDRYNVTFDSTLKATIKCGSREVFYVSLSGGQKQKLDLAVMFALSDLSRKYSRDYLDFVLLDEVGENLDLETIADFYILLQAFQDANGIGTVFVITHNQLLKETLAPHATSLRVELTGNESRIINE